MKGREFELLGIPIWQGTKEEILDLIISGDEYLELFSINAEIAIGQAKDSKWRSLYLNNIYNLVDGYWVKKALEYKYKVSFEKLSGSDLIYDFCEIANHFQERIFFVGGEQSVADQALLNIREKYPDIFVEHYSPPFEKGENVSQKENLRVISKIQEFQPQYIIACLGAPKQELWLHQNKSVFVETGVKAVMGAGGSLDFVAGKVPRAPVYLQNIGLEWLYRLYKEPSRWKRQVSLIPFAIRASFEALLFRLRK